MKKRNLLFLGIIALGLVIGLVLMITDPELFNELIGIPK
jgi:hypothetical protein